MPAVIPAIASLSAWTVTVAGTQFAVGAFLVNTVSSIAMSALATALRGKPEVRQPGITTTTTTAGGTVPQRLDFGRYATAGQMVAPMMVYQSDGNPNEWLVYVISLADKPVTGLGRIIVDGRYHTIDGNPAASQHGDGMGATTLDLVNSDWDGLRNDIFIRFHDGNQTTPDAYLRRVFGDYPERPWTADMIGHGVPYVVVTFKGKAGTEDYSGFPSIKFEVDGHKLLDPRDGQVKFTRNPAVIAWNILRGIDIPGGDVWGVGARGFVPGYVIAAANTCDSLVPKAGGGTRVRYQAGLEVSVSDEPHQALTEMVKAMGGDVADMGGTWLLTAGDPGTAVLSITDDDIIVTDSRSLKPYPGLDETVNAIHASYPDPAQQWEAKEAVPLYNAAWEASDGGRRLIAEVDFPAVPYPMQVRALMGEMAADHRRMRTHVITLPPDALGVKLGDHIAWSSAVNGYSAKLFKVSAMRIDPVSLCVAFTIKERDPSDYDYDPDRDGIVPTVPSPQPVAPVIEGITGWDVQAVNAGGRPGIRMVWNPEINARALSWVIRLASDGSEANSGTTSDMARGENVQTAGLKPSTTYLVTGRLVIPGRGTESVTTSVTTLPIGMSWDDLTGEVRDSVQSLEGWANSTGGFYRDVLDEMGIVRDEVIEGQFQSFTEREKLRADIRQVEVNLGQSQAQAIDALVVRVEDTEDGLAAQSDALTLVEAKTDAGTAGGLLRVTAQSGPAGVLARAALSVAATAGGPTTEAAVYLDAKAGGNSQFIARADRFALVTGPSGTPQFPFVADGSSIVMDADVWVKNLSVGTAKIAGQSVASSAFLEGGTNDLTLTYVLTGLPGETYQTFIIAGNTVSTTAWLRLYVNGVQRWAEQPIGGTLATRAVGTDLAPGTHTIRLFNENPVNSNSSSLAVWTRKR